jgi:hypothetical protein
MTAHCSAEAPARITAMAESHNRPLPPPPTHSWNTLPSLTRLVMKVQHGCSPTLFPYCSATPNPQPCANLHALLLPTHISMTYMPFSSPCCCCCCRRCCSTGAVWRPLVAGVPARPG